MVNNVNGSDGVTGRQVQQKNLQSLMNSKKLQQNNPYSGFAVSDQADISNEAIKLFSKEQEIEYYKNLLMGDDSDVDNAKVDKIKAMYESGQYQMPSDDQLADMLLDNQDFKGLMDL